MTYYLFTDLVRLQECALIVSPGKPPVVKHPGCIVEAEVTVELDAFYCRFCGWNGRVSGAWVHDMMTVERRRSGDLRYSDFAVSAFSRLVPEGCRVGRRALDAGAGRGDAFPVLCCGDDVLGFCAAWSWRLLPDPGRAGDLMTGHFEADEILQEALTDALTSFVRMMPLHVSLVIHQNEVLTEDEVVWLVPLGRVVNTGPKDHPVIDFTRERE